MEHKLVDDTLIVERDGNGKALGILARCTCGWTSSHFTSMSASSAFMDHQDSVKSEVTSDAKK